MATNAEILVEVVDRSLLSPDIEIAKAPTIPAAGVTFQLEPLPVVEVPSVSPEEAAEEIPVEVAAPITKKVTKKKVTTAAAQAAALAAAEVPKEEVTKVIEVPIYQGVPTDVGVGTYLGVVWAATEKEAANVILTQFGGYIEDYVFDLYSKGARPYFVIRKPPSPTILPEELPREFQQSPLTIIEASKSPFWIAICPVDGERVEVPWFLTSSVCSVDGTIIERPATF